MCSEGVSQVHSFRLTRRNTEIQLPTASPANTLRGMTSKPSVPQPRWWETILAIGLDAYLPGANQVAGKFVPNSFQRRQQDFLQRLADDVHQHTSDMRKLQERVDYVAFVQRVARLGTETVDELKGDALLRVARRALTDVPPEEWQVRDL